MCRVAVLTFIRELFIHDALLVDRHTKENSPIMKIKRTSKWTFSLALIALALMVVAGLDFSASVSASGGNDLGTSPFDFSDTAYRAHGVVPENIVLRVGTASRAGDFVVDNTNTDPNLRNI